MLMNNQKKEELSLRFSKKGVDNIENGEIEEVSKEVTILNKESEDINKEEICEYLRDSGDVTGEESETNTEVSETDSMIRV